MKSLFPKQEWTDFALNEIQNSGLLRLTPADSVEFRLDGTAESWVHLLAAMAKHESSFKPELTYNEEGELEGVVSTGLLQLSYKSMRGYARYAAEGALREQIASTTTEMLKDPLFNIRMAIFILHHWVMEDGVVATPTSPWKGGARYWSVLRKGAPKVKDTLYKMASALPQPGVALRLSNAPNALAAVAAAAAANQVPKEVSLAYQARENFGSKCNWIFEVDYSINSKFPRFFVYSLKDKKLYKYKCAHGKGGANEKPHDGRTREVSNVANSYCSSLGLIKTGEVYDSEVVGKAVRLHGQSATNFNIFARGVVLHGGDYVSDNEAGTDQSISGRSLGCIVVDDRYINRKKGGELVEWLKDGSIGVAHYKGAFKIQ